ncbi:GlxA family transcriptional regulator [Neptunicella marina]|uniref:AraC family transcriptional regulator n=1 Tax=Neptunicella marina TaxID=2125989 RepID=A0A8J6LWN6_9ALTE|nr:helix-turn-helix domain-containing protein [Neptunicella marina]MBC3764270.1 AraC family transcriptional regulator [Neptunicella marina]
MKTAILVYPDISMFELACAVELFALPRPELKRYYDADVVSLEDTQSSTTAGLVLNTQIVNSLDAYDMVVIASWPVAQREIPSHLASELLEFYQSGKRLVSFCSGAFLLAELGILNAKTCSTHWRYATEFVQRYKRVNFSNDVLYCIDGNVATSAGSAAALDLGLALIRQDFGLDTANAVAKRLVLPVHRNATQSQFVEAPVISENKALSSSMDWAITNLQHTISINQFAEKANMSRRNFDRCFKKATNLTPQQWLIMQRLERASQMLQQTNLNIEQVSSQAGFENSLTFRHHFKAKFGCAPLQYRHQHQIAVTN